MYILFNKLLKNLCEFQLGAYSVQIPIFFKCILFSCFINVWGLESAEVEMILSEKENTIKDVSPIKICWVPTRIGEKSSIFIKPFTYDNFL